MARLMILLVVVAVSLLAVLACPPDENAMEREMRMCSGGMQSAAPTMAAQCSAINEMITCMHTALEGCEGVAYVEARRGEVDAQINSMKSMYQMRC